MSNNGSNRISGFGDVPDLEKKIKANLGGIAPDPVEVEQEPKRTLPKSKSWSVIKKTAYEETRMIIEGVLNQGAKMTVGGASKAGKTWLLMMLALAIATGTPWLGMQTYTGKVFYVNFELQEEFFRKRGDLIQEKLEIPDPPEGNFEVWHLRGHFMTAKKFKEAIIEEIGDRKFDAIIIDPLYKLLAGADANSAGEMQAILAELEQIAVGAGGALIYADHFAKGNMSERRPVDRISGSGVNARDPDAIITLTELEMGEGLAVECTLRNFKPIAPFCISKIDHTPLWERNDTLDPKRLAGTPGQRPVSKETDLLLFMPDEGGIESKDWYESMNLVTKISDRTFNGHRAKLKKEGFVFESKLTGPNGLPLWVKSPNGLILQRRLASKSKESDEPEPNNPASDPFA